jgi:type I restriction enzyme S subunit
MAGEWRDSTLGDVTDFLSGGTPSKSKADYWNGSIPWVSAKDMKQFRLRDTEDHVTELGAFNGTRLVPAGSVLLLVRGMTLLNDLPICVVTKPMTFNQDVKALRPSANIIDDFLPYLLLGHKDRLLSRVDLAGHGTGRLNSDELKALEIGLPPKAEQRAIAHILGTLDDKIELNRRRNQTLEAMARALFKDWFVDFGPVRAKMEGREPYLPADLWQLFPERLDDGGNPEGWEMQPLSELLTIIGGGTPKTSVEEYWGGDIPWFSVVDTPSASDVFVVATEKTITDQGVAGSSARLIPKGTTIISARGTVGNLAVAGREMTFNQSCYGLRGTGSAGDYFVYLTAQQMVDQLKSMAHGSVFSTITRQTFEAIKRPVPSPGVLTAFEGLVRGWFDAILSSVEESRTLEQLRDTLLPALISGETRINPLPILSSKESQ